MVQECNARVRVAEDACLEWLPVSVKMRWKSHWIGVTFYIPIMRTVPTRVAGISSCSQPHDVATVPGERWENHGWQDG